MTHPYRSKPPGQEPRKLGLFRRIRLGWKARRWHRAMKETLRLASVTQEEVLRMGVMGALKVFEACDKLKKPYPMSKSKVFYWP